MASALEAALEAAGLIRYASVLEEQGYDLDALAELLPSERDGVLASLGVLPGHRLKFRAFLRGTTSAAPPPPEAPTPAAIGLDIDDGGSDGEFHDAASAGAFAPAHTCGSTGHESSPAHTWCLECGVWICGVCEDFHASIPSLKSHTLSSARPAVPFWEQLNLNRDADGPNHGAAQQHEVLAVDLAEPRLIKRHPAQWAARAGSASAEHVPVCSFVGPTGSGKSFLLTALLPAAQRRANGGPTVSTPGQHIPESGNVFAFDTDTVPGFDKTLLLDFEGEDGALPRTLLKKLKAWAQATVARGAHNIYDSLPKSLVTLVESVSSTWESALPTSMLSLVRSASLPDAATAATAAAAPPPGSPTKAAPGSPTKAAAAAAAAAPPASPASAAASAADAAAVAGMNSELLAWTQQRRETVNTVLPVLGYLVSDVIVFVDTCEPRRLNLFFERVQQFASAAWVGCRASGWQPALIMVQNKWHYTAADPDTDITDTFNAAVDTEKTLSKIFASVHFLRMPHSNHAAACHRATEVLHATIAEAAAAVKRRRERNGTLFSEREWWSLAPLVAEEYSRSRVPISLPRLRIRQMTPDADDHHGVSELFDMVEAITAPSVPAGDSDALFDEVKRGTLSLYRGATAVQTMRHLGNASSVPGDFELHARESYLLAGRAVEEFRRCGAVHEWNGRRYRCTQLRRGHGKVHRNPAVLKADSGGLLGWVGWKHDVPCQWEGAFVESDAFADAASAPPPPPSPCPTPSPPPPGGGSGLPSPCPTPPPPRAVSRAPSEDLWWMQLKVLVDLTAEEMFWALVSVAVEEQLDAHPRLTWRKHTCARCLATSKAATDLEGAARMLSGCGHFLCEACVAEGRAAAALRGRPSAVCCGFCGRESDWVAASELLPPGVGPRVLTLDGGGIRGLVEIVVLDHIVSMVGVPVHELFDVVGGTSTGGILALAFGMKKFSTAEAREFYTDLTKRIFRRSFWGRVLSNEMMYLFSLTILDNSTLKGDLERLFAHQDGEQLALGEFPLLPKVFVTMFDVVDQKTAIMGNIDPKACSRAAEAGGGGTAEVRAVPADHVTLAEAALATAAAPLYFPQISIDDRLYADGGVDANCPCAEALAVAAATWPGRRLEQYLSVGTGTVAAEPADRNAPAGFDWVNRFVDMQLCAERRWDEEAKRLSDEVRAACQRISPEGLGDFDSMAADRVDEILEQTQALASEPPLRAAIASAADVCRAKMYFVLLPPSPPEASAGGPPVVLRLAHRRVERAAFPAAAVRRFGVRVAGPGGVSSPAVARSGAIQLSFSLPGTHKVAVFVELLDAKSMAYAGEGENEGPPRGSPISGSPFQVVVKVGGGAEPERRHSAA